MKMIVACECSGIVREAFRAKGHDAYSCDILPAIDCSPYHFQCDMFSLDYSEFDLLIAHPDCTFLSNAGLHFCIGNKDRQKKRDAAVETVKRISALPVKKIAIENPPGYLSTAWRKPDQTVRMNWFGHAEAIKPTSLWLKNLPLIKKTNEVEPRRRGHHGCSEWYALTKDKKKRSITFSGFAQAMAEQWGSSDHQR